MVIALYDIRGNKHGFSLSKVGCLELRLSVLKISRKLMLALRQMNTKSATAVPVIQYNHITKPKVVHCVMDLANAHHAMAHIESITNLVLGL